MMLRMSPVLSAPLSLRATSRPSVVLRESAVELCVCVARTSSYRMRHWFKSA